MQVLLALLTKETVTTNDNDDDDGYWSPYNEDQMIAFMNSVLDQELSDREIDRFYARLSEVKQQRSGGHHH